MTEVSKALFASGALGLLYYTRVWSKAKHMESKEEIWRRYDLTPKGFLPDNCLERLPAYYDAWEKVAASLVELNRTRKIRQAIEAMPVLDCSEIRTVPELRRAYILLGFFVHCYVNNENCPWEVLDSEMYKPGTGVSHRELPEPLAVPFHIVCQRLGILFAFQPSFVV